MRAACAYGSPFAFVLLSYWYLLSRLEAGLRLGTVGASSGTTSKSTSIASMMSRNAASHARIFSIAFVTLSQSPPIIALAMLALRA